jgi:uncharacterized membrane protein YjfL (UPF0719 family)
VLASIGYAVAYTAVGLVLLAIGYLVLDLLTPGHLGRHIYEDRSVSAGIVLAGRVPGAGRHHLHHDLDQRRRGLR